LDHSFIQNLWERCGLRGVAFVVLALFVLFRIYQLLFQHRTLKRERLRGNYIAQTILGLFLTFGALVLCEPRIAGLPEDIFGFGPQSSDPSVSHVQSATRSPKKPDVNWGGPLAGVEAEIDNGDWKAAALKLYEPRRNGVKAAQVVCSWDPYVAPLAHAYAALGQSAAERGDRALARQYLGVSLDLLPDAEVYLVKATLEEPEDWKVAIEDLERASRRAKTGDYRAVEARLTIRMAHLQQGETRGALSDLDAILTSRPSDLSLLTQRGRLRLALGAVDGAIADLESASRTRLDVPGRLILADARIQKGSEAQLKLAAADLDQVLHDMKEADSPRDAYKAHLLRAEVRLALRQLADALPDASRAIQWDPKSAEAYYLRGRIEIEVDRVNAAKADLEQATKLDPKHRRAIVWHGMLVYESDPKRGLLDFQRAIEIEPDAWAHYYRGECLLRLGEGDDALAAFNEALLTAQDDKLTKLARDGAAHAKALKRK
jgi:tetratricopeptide (TPR) repeat protein